MRKLLFVLFCGIFSISAANSKNFTALDPDNLPAPVEQPVTNPAIIPTSGAVFYTDLTLFMEDCGNVITNTVEDFEDNLIIDNAIAEGLSPLNNATDDGVFSPGDIEDGVEINVVVNTGDNSYQLLTSGFGGVLNDAITPKFYDNDLEISFSVPANAVSFNIFDRLANGDFTIEAFGSGGSLGSANIVAAGTAGVFVGVLAAEYIERIEIRDNVLRSVVMLYDISFGVCSDQPIPTMGEWGIIVLTISLSIFALVAIRNRKYIFG